MDTRWQHDVSHSSRSPQKLPRCGPVLSSHDLGRVVLWLWAALPPRPPKQPPFLSLSRGMSLLPLSLEKSRSQLFKIGFLNPHFNNSNLYNNKSNEKCSKLESIQERFTSRVAVTVGSVQSYLSFPFRLTHLLPSHRMTSGITSHTLLPTNSASSDFFLRIFSELFYWW